MVSIQGMNQGFCSWLALTIASRNGLLFVILRREVYNSHNIGDEENQEKSYISKLCRPYSSELNFPKAVFEFVVHIFAL